MTSSFEAAFGPIHYELGVNYNNLAALHAARGDLREAENLYQRALNIKQQLLEHNHPDVAMTLHNLAMLYTQQGDHDRARAYSRARWASSNPASGPNTRKPLEAEPNSTHCPTATPLAHDTPTITPSRLFKRLQHRSCR